MGKAAGVSRRRKKIASHRYSSSKKLKRVRRAELKKSGGINNDVIRQAWDSKQTLRKNLSNMGLSHDPNKLFAKMERDRVKAELQQRDEMVLNQSTTLKLHEQLIRQREKLQAKKKRRAAKKGGDAFTVEEIDEQNGDKPKLVADQLEEQASKPAAKNFRFGPDNIKFCAYMIEKYGDDYEAMVRDKQNRYQESAGQIRAKIRRFLAIPEHQRVYEKAKQMVAAQIDDSDDSGMES